MTSSLDPRPYDKITACSLVRAIFYSNIRAKRPQQVSACDLEDAVGASLQPRAPTTTFLWSMPSRALASRSLLAQLCLGVLALPLLLALLRLMPVAEQPVEVPPPLGIAQTPETNVPIPSSEQILASRNGELKFPGWGRNSK